MKQFVIFAALMACGAAQAQKVDCAKFLAAVEFDQKTMSLGAVSSGQDGGRDAALAAAAASRIQSNLIIMQSAGCKLPTEPISAAYYIGNALECNMKSRFGAPAESTEACTTGKWERKK